MNEISSSYKRGPLPPWPVLAAIENRRFQELGNWERPALRDGVGYEYRINLLLSKAKEGVYSIHDICIMAGYGGRDSNFCKELMRRGVVKLVSRAVTSSKNPQMARYEIIGGQNDLHHG